MASGGWSNIFLQLMAGDTPPGLPVVGEGLLEGWWTAIELISFNWSVTAKETAGKNKSALGSALAAAGGAATGVVAGLVGGQTALAAAAAAAAVASAIADAKKNPTVELGSLSMTKRFDISSSRIQNCVDNNVKIQSALITVLHIKQGSRMIHEPGFTLLATDGYFEKVDVKMEKGDKGVEVTEELTLKFKSIMITYSKKLGIDNVPMPPFLYSAPTESAT